MTIPRCGGADLLASAITIGADEVLLEPVRVLDGRWVVRRDGRLVRLDRIEPEPAALILFDGRVADGSHRQWPGLREFLADHGVGISGKDAKEAARAGRLRAHRYWDGSLEAIVSDAGVSATLGRGLAA